MESLKALSRLAGETGEFSDTEALDTKRISFLVAGNEGLTPAEKQKLLEMTSTRSRLERGVKSLQKVLQRRKLTEEIQQIIGGNGSIMKMLKRYGTE